MSDSQPIPATEFDFSTIKADLKPSVPFRVHYQAVITAAEAAIKASEDIADAMEKAGYARGYADGVKASQPKTLRERAIEAARSVVDDRDYLEDIVTAVLAEVEKAAI